MPLPLCGPFPRTSSPARPPTLLPYGGRYQGPCDSPKFGTLVVVLPTENHSWTFKFRVEPA